MRIFFWNFSLSLNLSVKVIKKFVWYGLVKKQTRYTSLKFDDAETKYFKKSQDPSS